MKKLSVEKRAAILQCLVEGMSVAAAVRITGVTKKAILALLGQAGEALTAYQDERMRDLQCEELQLDEVWSFVGCREKTKKSAKGEHPGDVWTWTALCAKSKLIPAWRVGDRSMRTGYAFCADLASRVNGQCQITSDGHPVYRSAVGMNFPEADFAMLIKIYGQDEEGKETVIGIRKEAVQGTPAEEKISTSFVERANLTIRMGNRRFTRLTNGYSKKVQNHVAMLALQLMHYNYCRKHMSLAKQTPAMAAGIASRQLTMAEVVGIIDEYFQGLQELAFEQAFAEKYTAPRTEPKSHTPTPKAQLKLPWYLDPNSGGEPKDGSDYNH